MIAQNRILWLPGDVETRGGWDEDFTGRASAGIRINADTALRCTVVLGCIRVLAEGVAGLPLHLYRRRPDGGKEIARNHPLYHVLHVSPNQWQTSFEWREQQMLHLGLHGNSYNEIRSGSRGAVSELLPLHPSRMTVERIENGRLRYTYREQDGSQTIYTQDQIMHVRWMSNDGILGMVPIELARDAIALARACEIHGSSFFANGARPGFVLTTDGDLSQEAAVALRDNWERMHRGADRSHRTAVLSGGLKPFELGGASNQESQFLESRRFQTEEICRIFRVPPHLVGDLTRSSFSNIEQQSIDFIQHTLLSWLRRFETAFARDLITDDTYFAEFDTRGVLRGDASARASYYSTLWSLGVASVNEIRGWENLNPVPDGDERFVQLNMQTLGNASKPPEDPAAATPADAPDEQERPTADVGGLLAILEQVGAGTVTPDAAVAIIGSVFPAMPEATAAAIVAGVAPAPAVPALPAPPQGGPGEPSGAGPVGAGPTPDPAADKPPGSPGVPSRSLPDPEARDCGTGAGGFQPGNKCAGEGGGGAGGIPDAKSLKQVKRLGGSTGAVLAEDGNGNKFVVKGGNSPDHIRSEAAANDIYRAAGVPVPEHKLDDSGPSPKQVTEYVPGPTLDTLSGAAFEKAAASLREHFAADALLANWDVIGLSQDNIVVPSDGRPAMRIDNGGSLDFRAQGKPKAFGPTVGEIDSMRTSDQGKPIFGKLSDADVASQIGSLTARRDAIVAATPDKHKDTISARLDYMEKWAKGKASKRSISKRNCGTGAGGFGEGNTCAKGGGLDAAQTIGSGKKAGAWLGKKGYPASLVKTAGHAKLHGILLAQAKAQGLSAKEAKAVAKQKLKNALDPNQAGGPEGITALAKKYKLDLDSEDNQKPATELKNDPGIYAGEKAMAAGLLTPPPPGANSNISGVNKVMPPPAAPKLPVPPQQPPPPPKPDLNAPAVQPRPNKAGPSSTPGKAPPGKLPTNAPDGWVPETQPPSITPTQQAVIKALPIAREAIKHYTGSSYENLNATLRQQSSNTASSFSDLEKLPQRTALLVASLDGVTRAESHSKPFTVYRGTGINAAKQIDKLGVGQVWQDAGYMSCTSSRAFAESWENPDVVMKISTQYGVNVKSLSSVGPHEGEHLLPRRSQFRIKSKEWRWVNSRARLYVELEHIGWHP